MSPRSVVQEKYPGMKNTSSIKLVASAFLFLSAAACGADTGATGDEMTATYAAAGSDATVEAPEVWPQPDPATLADGPHKDQVLYGEALIRSTYDYVGPDVPRR